MRISIQAITAGVVAAIIGYSTPSAVAVAAPQSNKASTPLIQQADASMTWQLGTAVRNGTVLSMNPTHMVIACRRKGRIAQLDFILNGVTVQRGEIVVGSQVTVHYRTQDSRNFATSIQLRRAWSPPETVTSLP